VFELQLNNLGVLQKRGKQVAVAVLLISLIVLFNAILHQAQRRSASAHISGQDILLDTYRTKDAFLFPSAGGLLLHLEVKHMLMLTQNQHFSENELGCRNAEIHVITVHFVQKVLASRCCFKCMRGFCLQCSP